MRRTKLQLPPVLLVVIAGAVLVGLQLLDRAQRKTDRATGPSVLVLKRSAACPIDQAPAWVHGPGTTLIEGPPPMGGFGYVNDDFAYYGMWRDAGWTFRLVGFRPVVWIGWGDVIWSAFRGIHLTGRGVFTTTFTDHGILFTASWRRPRCITVTMVGTTDGVARWLDAHVDTLTARA